MTENLCERIKVGRQDVIERAELPIYRGHFSAVYHGKFDDKAVVVKEIEKKDAILDLGERKGELGILREIDHENVVKYLFKDVDDRYLYIVLEKCDCTLGKYIEDDRGKMNHVGILWQITCGLAYLHNKRNIIHRDLKPSNILMMYRDENWIVKITDFGISKKLAPDRSKLTQTSIKGTLSYMAPECGKEKEKITQRSDIFSLGLVCCFVLSEGSHPFGKDSLEVEAAIHLQETEPNLDIIKEEYKYDCQTLIHSMIARKPEERLDITQVQAHQIFWDAEKKLSFMEQVSDYIITPRQFKAMEPKLELKCEEIVGDWRKRVDDDSPTVGKVFKAMRGKQGDGICALLRNIRNLKHHYEEKEEEFKTEIGSLPFGVYKYFKRLFPRLWDYIYQKMESEKEDRVLQKYYLYKEQHHHLLTEKEPLQPTTATHTKLSVECNKVFLEEGKQELLQSTHNLYSENQKLETANFQNAMETILSTARMKGVQVVLDQSSCQEEIVPAVCSITGTGLTREIRELGVNVREKEQSSIQLRSYQWELAAQALTGQNSLIVAPTGSGKTAVLAEVICQHMKKQEAKRVMFFVPKTALAHQQFWFLKNYLSKELDVRQMIGQLAAEEDAGKTLLKSQLTVLTPQILINELGRKSENRRLSFADVSLLIFDECHNATKNHPYRKLMDLLLDFQDDNPQGPSIQVIGVTASPGVGRGGDMEKVQKNLIELLSNLNIMSAPSVVEKNMKELEQHHSKIKEYFIQIETEKNFADEILKVVTELESDVQKLTKNLCKTAPGNKATQPYENWVDNLKEFAKLHIEQGEQSSHLIACAEHLKMYHVLLQLKDLVPNSMELTKKSGAFTGEAPVYAELTRKYEGLYKKAVDTRTPMFDRLLEEIRKEFKASPDGRCIIFVERKVTAKCLQKNLNAYQDVASLHPVYVTGSKSSGGAEGTSEEEQNNILGSFKSGKCKVLIATSVLEEGLDVEKCNLVVMYNYVTGEVGRIQRYGRGRASNSKAVIFTTQHSDHKERESENRSSAEATKKAMECVKKMKPEELKQLVKDAQRQHKVERKRKRKAVPDPVDSGEPPAKWKILCGTCKNFLTTGDKLRHIEDQHTIVKDKEFKLKVERRMVQKQKGPKIKGNSDFHCNGDTCKMKVALGMEYRNRVYPALSIKKIIVEDEKGTTIIPRKRKNLPFRINRGVDDSDDDDDLFEEYEESKPVLKAESLNDQDCMEMLDMMNAG